MSTTAALIVSAGQGLRAGGGQPKQFRPIGGIPVLRRSLDLFLAHAELDRILTVIGPNDAAQYGAVAPHSQRLMPPVVGGECRQESVRRGLAALSSDPPDRVLIHDAARPFASPVLIARVIEALGSADAVLPALPVTNTLKAVDAAGVVTGTVPRDGLYAAETPQGFSFDLIRDAHERAAAAGVSVTDDAAVAEWAGIPVHVVPGEPGNVKLTTAADMAEADLRLRVAATMVLGETRVGTGYDVHPFGPGDGVTLGGVAIPSDTRLLGHSDADVVLHALTDAILGALADGDIGAHFPPSDPQWRGAASDRFVGFAVDRLRERGGVLVNADIAIIAESPRIAPHRDAMRARIAAICGITADRVGVKATTNERLGFIGRGEGIAALATATVRLPFGAA